MNTVQFPIAALQNSLFGLVRFRIKGVRISHGSTVYAIHPLKMHIQVRLEGIKLQNKISKLEAMIKQKVSTDSAQYRMVQKIQGAKYAKKFS